jgi:ATP adenylyltransferase
MDRIYAPWRSKYFALEKRDACLFCEIQNEQDDGLVGILRRAEHWFVILNLFPYTNGHIMIVAKRHIESFAELKDEEGSELIHLCSLCEGALRAAYEPDGLNIGVNLGASAGAGVEGHLHVHLCPRWTGDTNFMTSIAETRVVSEEMEESYKRLSPHFDD